MVFRIAGGRLRAPPQRMRRRSISPAREAGVMEERAIGDVASTPGLRASDPLCLHSVDPREEPEERLFNYYPLRTTTIPLPQMPPCGQVCWSCCRAARPASVSPILASNSVRPRRRPGRLLRREPYTLDGKHIRYRRTGSRHDLRPKRHGAFSRTLRFRGWIRRTGLWLKMDLTVIDGMNAGLPKPTRITRLPYPDRPPTPDLRLDQSAISRVEKPE